MNSETGKGSKSAKAALLTAGEDLINRKDDIDVVTVDAVIKAAGLKRKDFREHFKDRKAYLHALLLHMFDEIRADVLQSGMAVSKPGHERVWKCMEAYLDSNLKRRGMRALVAGLASDAAAAETVRRRTNGYGMVIKLELDAMVVPHAAIRARFCAVMAQEAAAAEHDAGKMLTDVRAALYSFVCSL
jgi:AcrR family transcriptional regulator